MEHTGTNRTLTLLLSSAELVISKIKTLKIKTLGLCSLNSILQHEPSTAAGSTRTRQYHTPVQLPLMLPQKPVASQSTVGVTSMTAVKLALQLPSQCVPTVLPAVQLGKERLPRAGGGAQQAAMPQQSTWLSPGEQCAA